MSVETNESRRAAVGWLYVAVQFMLIVSLVLLPDGDDWSMSFWVVWAGRSFTIVGFIVMGVAALRLGLSLTPTPVPRKNASLKTTGMYRFVRHPIYSGLLLTIAGLALLSGSWLHAFISVVAVIFFNQKAKWEEVQLCDRYDGYQQYMDQTPRFIPWRWPL